MLQTFTGIVVALCLVFFAAVNLENLLQYHAGFAETATASKTPEVVRPMAIPLLLAGLGTAAFFLESCLYVILDLSNMQLHPFAPNLLGGAQEDSVALFGLLVMVLGYVIFNWSVVVRGRYATSWQMPANHKLVDWGPYRYVRHPSYLGYFLMFAGFLLLWQDALSLIPLIAMPGYALITRREEEMLAERFGAKYLQYQKQVGRFLPRLRSLNASSRGDRRHRPSV